MTTLQAAWLGVGLGVLGLAAIAWLKGAFDPARAMARKLAHEGGEPWTLAAAAEPFLALVAVFFVVAFGLAHPESRWARWFYGDGRLARPGERYAETAERNSGDVSRRPG